jgi:hypothetical protein
LCNFLHFPVTSSPLGLNTLLSTPFSNTLHLSSSLRARHQCHTHSKPLFKRTATIYRESRDSSVHIALDYGMDDRDSRVRFPAEDGDNFSLHHHVQNGSGSHPASYRMGTRGSFPGGKAAGAWSWPLTSI